MLAEDDLEFLVLSFPLSESLLFELSDLLSLSAFLLSEFLELLLLSLPGLLLLDPLSSSELLVLEFPELLLLSLSELLLLFELFELSLLPESLELLEELEELEDPLEEDELPEESDEELSVPPLALLEPVPPYP